jgi:hypothetical protein
MVSFSSYFTVCITYQPPLVFIKMNFVSIPDGYTSEKIFIGNFFLVVVFEDLGDLKFA